MFCKNLLVSLLLSLVIIGLFIGCEENNVSNVDSKQLNYKVKVTKYLKDLNKQTKVVQFVGYFDGASIKEAYRSNYISLGNGIAGYDGLAITTEDKIQWNTKYGRPVQCTSFVNNFREVNFIYDDKGYILKVTRHEQNKIDTSHYVRSNNIIEIIQPNSNHKIIFKIDEQSRLIMHSYYNPELYYEYNYIYGVDGFCREYTRKNEFGQIEEGIINYGADGIEVIPNTLYKYGHLIPEDKIDLYKFDSKGNIIQSPAYDNNIYEYEYEFK